MGNSLNYKPDTYLKKAEAQDPIVTSVRLDSLTSKSISLDQESKAIFFIILVSQIFLSNGFYLFACILTIYFIFYYLQQPLKSGVFAVIAFNHFLQIIASIWQANSVGKDINFRSSNMSDATIVSLIGLVFLFLPVIYFQNKLPSLSYQDLKKEADKLSIENTFNCYLVSFFIASFLSTILFMFAGLAQVESL